MPGDTPARVSCSTLRYRGDGSSGNRWMGIIPPCSEHPALLGGVTSLAQRAGVGPKSRLMSSARQIFFQCCFVEELPPQRPSVTLENISPAFLSSPSWPTPSSPACLTRCPPCASTARRTHLALRSFTLVALGSGSVHLPGGVFPEASARGTGEACRAWQPHQGITVIRPHFPPVKGLCPSSPGTGELHRTPSALLTPEARCGRERAKGVWADPGWDLCFAIS